MTLDEAIAHEREVAKDQKSKYDKCPTRMRYDCGMCFHNPKCNEIAEYHKQLAEWLEELKDLRELKDTITSNAEVLEMQGYNKAIDDFAEKLNAKCDGMIKEKWNSNVAPISWAESYADFKDDIEEIAEQLKESYGE